MQYIDGICKVATGLNANKAPSSQVASQKNDSNKRRNSFLPSLLKKPSPEKVEFHKIAHDVYSLFEKQLAAAKLQSANMSTIGVSKGDNAETDVLEAIQKATDTIDRSNAFVAFTQQIGLDGYDAQTEIHRTELIANCKPIVKCLEDMYETTTMPEAVVQELVTAMEKRGLKKNSGDSDEDFVLQCIKHDAEQAYLAAAATNPPPKNSKEIQETYTKLSSKSTLSSKEEQKIKDNAAEELNAIYKQTFDKQDRAMTADDKKFFRDMNGVNYYQIRQCNSLSEIFMKLDFKEEDQSGRNRNILLARVLANKNLPYLQCSLLKKYQHEISELQTCAQNIKMFTGEYIDRREKQGIKSKNDYFEFYREQLPKDFLRLPDLIKNHTKEKAPSNQRRMSLS